MSVPAGALDPCAEHLCEEHVAYRAEQVGPLWHAAYEQARHTCTWLAAERTRQPLLGAGACWGLAALTESYRLEFGGASVIEGAAIIDPPQLDGLAKLQDSGMPLFTLVNFAGH